MRIVPLENSSLESSLLQMDVSHMHVTHGSVESTSVELGFMYQGYSGIRLPHNKAVV